MRFHLEITHGDQALASQKLFLKQFFRIKKTINIIRLKHGYREHDFGILDRKRFRGLPVGGFETVSKNSR